MSTESVKAQRITYDTMKAKKMSPDSLVISNEMCRSCLTVSSRRRAALEDAKKQYKNTEGSTTGELEKSMERSDEPDQRCQYNKD